MVSALDDAIARQAESIHRRVATALGQAPADLLLKDCQVVNLYSEEIYQADVAIVDGKIVAVRENYQGQAAQVLDCRGLYAVPGPIEPHMHFESTFATEASNGHGCSTFAEVLACVRQGKTVFMMETLGRSQLSALLEDVIRHGLDTRHLCFCIDHASSHDNDRERQGGLERLVVLAQRAGIPPIQAFQMASLNVAMYCGLDHQRGSVAPGRCADVLLLRGLDQFPPAYVLVDGELVARDGQPLWPLLDQNLRVFSHL